MPEKKISRKETIKEFIISTLLCLVVFFVSSMLLLIPGHFQSETTALYALLFRCGIPPSFVSFIFVVVVGGIPAALAGMLYSYRTTKRSFPASFFFGIDLLVLILLLVIIGLSIKFISYTWNFPLFFCIGALLVRVFSARKKVNTEEVKKIKAEVFALTAFVFFSVSCSLYFNQEEMDLNSKYKGLEKISKREFTEIKQLLLEYAGSKNRMPSTEEGMYLLKRLNKAIDVEREADFGYAYCEWYFATSEGCKKIKFLLDPWDVPYIYENHDGNSGLYYDSPALKDTFGRYSVRIGNNAYVYSLGAKHEFGETVKFRFIRILKCGIPLLLSLIALFISFRYEKKEKKNKLTIILKRTLFVIVLITVTAPMYAYTLSFIDRSWSVKPYLKQGLSELTVISDKYHEKKILSDSAYKDLQESIEIFKECTK